MRARNAALTALPDANVKYAKLKVQLSEIQRAQAAQKRATKGKEKTHRHQLCGRYSRSRPSESYP
jgi:hypothetical protein